ncbi:MAG TPA: hypothetical protein VGP76_03605 [Planctomycetaceae bacterium]|jgi:hypothetical protein|nr:hypothetical protein [Planctomycetaceae bacterium]
MLALPALAGLVAMIYTLASAGITKTNSAVSARYNAWHYRIGPPTAPTENVKFNQLPASGSPIDPGLVVRISRAKYRQYGADDGLIEGADNSNVPMVHPGFAQQLWTTNSHHALLGWTWDYRALPNTAEDHPRLDPPGDLIGAWGGDQVPLNDLLGLRTSTMGDISGAVNNWNNAYASKLSSLETQLTNLLNVKNQLESQLSNLKSMFPPNLGAISSLMSQISQITSQISQVENSINQLNNLQNQIPQPLN